MRFFGRKRGTDPPPPADVYRGLRQQVLGLTPDQLGDGFADAPILALLMETGYPVGVATLVGVADGTASLYFSSGGGFIGAGTHAGVADANRRWLESGLAFLPELSATSGMKVTKRHIFEPSVFDPPDQDQYEYWIYEFEVDGREYVVRRYTDEPERATILSNVRNADEQALADAAELARYLVDREGVSSVFRYDTKSGVFSRKVEPAPK